MSGNRPLIKGEIAKYLIIAFLMMGGFFYYLEQDSKTKDKGFSGKWVITEENSRTGFLQATVVVENPDIARDEVEPVLLDALEEIKRAYPDYRRFWLWLVHDERISWGIAAGKIEAEDDVRFFNGRPPADAYEDPKWIEAGLYRMNDDEMELAIRIEEYIREALSNGYRGDTEDLAASKFGIPSGEVAKLRRAFSLNYSPFTWASR